MWTCSSDAECTCEVLCLNGRRRKDDASEHCYPQLLEPPPANCLPMVEGVRGAHQDAPPVLYPPIVRTTSSSVFDITRLSVRESFPSTSSSVFDITRLPVRESFPSVFDITRLPVRESFPSTSSSVFDITRLSVCESFPSTSSSVFDTRTLSVPESFPSTCASVCDTECRSNRKRPHPDDTTPKRPQKKTQNYPQSSKSGKLYKRKQTKRLIECPVCSSKTSWLSRHLRQQHKVTAEEAKNLRLKLPWFRARRAEEKPVVKYHCTQRGCVEIVQHLRKHLIRFHGLQPEMILDSDLDAQEAMLVDANTSMVHSYAVIPEAVINLEDITEHTNAETVPLTSQEVRNNNEARLVIDQLRSEEDVESSGSEEEESRLDDKDYRKSLSKSTIKLVDEYTEWSASIPGGLHLGAKGYGRDVSIVLVRCGKSLRSFNTNNIFKHYMQQELKRNLCGLKPNDSFVTIKNRLRSAVGFAKFLLSHYEQFLKENDYFKEMQRIIQDLPNWVLSLRKKCAEQAVRRKATNQPHLLTDNDVNCYMSSKKVLKIEEILLQAEKEIEEGTFEGVFTRCRNHILTLLSLCNAPRSGALANMNLDEYSSAMGLASEGEDICVRVSDHKTSASYGAANVSISQKEMKLMDGYLRMRRQIKTDCASIFINATGTKMTQSNIANSIKTSFRQVGVKKNISCTQIRKFAVASVHANAPHLKQQLATLMCHSTRTAERSYLHDERAATSIKMGKFLRDRIGNMPSTVPENMPSTVPENMPSTVPESMPSTVPENMPSTVREISISQTTRQVEEAVLDVPDAEQVETNAHEEAVERESVLKNLSLPHQSAQLQQTGLVNRSDLPQIVARSQRRKVFSHDQEEELERIFHEIILFQCSGNPGRDISMRDVKKLMNDN